MVDGTQIFEGAYNMQMPKLVSEGLKPATAREIRMLQLAEKLGWEIYYDSATATFYAGNKQDNFKILLYSEDLASVNSQTPLFNGGILKTQEEYDKTKAREFSRKDMILRQRLTEKEALKHLGWKEILGDKLEKIVEYVFSHIGNEKTAMGLFLVSPQSKPNIRALYLDVLSNGADALDCYGLLLYGYARLVGVRKNGKATS